MIDAYLFSIRDAIHNMGADYDTRTCEIMATGQPPASAGDVFLAVHEGSSQSTMDNALDEYFSFDLTLTLRVRGIPLDRVGDKLLASQLARRTGPKGSPSFNARAEALRAFMHMNWGVIGDANNRMVAMEPDALFVYGFAEPARYRGMEQPNLKGGEWFWADADAEDVGLVAALHFEDARRLQALQSFV